MGLIDFSIIIIHYNQNDYLKNCIQKALKQQKINYELIIIDDYSTNFDYDTIKKYIEFNKKENLIKYNIIKNEENIGTVKTLNKAANVAVGEYIVFVAADDEFNNDHCLFDINNILTEKYEKKLNVLITQQLMFDQKLEKFYYNFMDERYIKSFNNLSSKQIFNILSKGCVFPSGSTIYKRKFIQKEKFDDRYKLIEDWPMFLKLSLNHKKMKYENINTINHRDCGISHSDETTSKHTDFIYDIYKIHEDILIPNLKKMNIINKIWVIKSYKFYKKNYSKGTENCQLNLQYYFINSFIILWYNFLKIKNFVDTTKFLNYMFVFWLLTGIIKNKMINKIFNITIIISIILIITNISYNCIEISVKKIKQKKMERR